nr:hypothetical protein Q903MT_gene846 [Picea sitchensis]
MVSSSPSNKSIPTVIFKVITFPASSSRWNTEFTLSPSYVRNQAAGIRSAFPYHFLSSLALPVIKPSTGLSPTASA